MAEGRLKNTSRSGARRPGKAATKGHKVGDYVCDVRGYGVPVDEACECAQFCDVDCSGAPMRTGRSPARVQGVPVRMVGDF